MSSRIAALFVLCSWAVCALDHYAVRQLVKQAEQSHSYLGENLERIKRVNFAQTYTDRAIEATLLLAQENSRLVKDFQELQVNATALSRENAWLLGLVEKLVPVAESMRRTMVENGLKVPEPWPLPLPPRSGNNPNDPDTLI